MKLSKLQKIFVFKVSKLIEYAYAHGYSFTFGEAYRTPEQAAINASKGVGIKNSLHTMRLAIDLNLFIGETYQTDSVKYREIGVFWESLSEPGINCCWGGRFKKPDGNHFSIEYNGVK